ncbi:MAG: hypothetical protein WC796_02675 [Candidatus Pacearchaeota archaeon]|jgi:hypothetical protein
MEKELKNFIKEYELNPFLESIKSKTIKLEDESILKTLDAKSVHKKVLTKISSNFMFKDTDKILKVFNFTTEKDKIIQRQEFFKSIIKELDNNFLKQITKPKITWKPNYDILVVTENENTFLTLKDVGCPVQLLTSPHDISDLDRYEIVQVIDCDEFSRVLETLPQSIFLNSIDEVYLERYVSMLSSWKNNIEIIQKNQTNEEITQITNNLSKLFFLFNNQESEKISRSIVEEKLEEINEEVSNKIKELTISGDSLFKMLSKSKLPDEFEAIINQSISKTNLPESVFSKKIPVEIDEAELEDIIKRQNIEEHSNVALNIKKYSNQLKNIPSELKKLSESLVFFDFQAGISKFSQDSNNFPEISDSLIIENSNNLFLDNAQPISFNLTSKSKCSILTGANSGGKTTLIEHIIQLISLFQIGLPTRGKVKLPLFSEVYYFAKNKGSTNKGAFENLLTQISKIKPGNKSLILADEIEAVTEPGVAGNIIRATAEYFTSKGCFMIIATHLGKHIQDCLPDETRIDGIEAKGLDDNFELIVDHNPVLGKLASSTPELIIERMAKSQGNVDFFRFLNEYMKK